jgi:hypothetical protein
MAMNTNIGHAVLKVNRANKHIADVKEAFRALEESYTSTIQRNPDTGIQEVVHAIPSLELALQELSPIVGDAVHNLRSALDIAWYSTILRLLPDKISDWTKFPVKETRKGVEDALHGIEVDTRCSTLFEYIMFQIQPYKGGHNSAVFVLNELDILDKHMIPLELASRAHVRGISTRDKNGQTWRGTSMLTKNTGISVTSFEEGMEIEDKGKLTVTVSLKQAGSFEPLPVPDLLKTLAQYTLFVVKGLEAIRCLDAR